MLVTIHFERLDALALDTVTFWDFVLPFRLLNDETEEPELLDELTELLELQEESDELEELESDMSAFNESYK